MSELTVRIRKHQERLQDQAAGRRAAERLAMASAEQWQKSHLALLAALNEANAEFKNAGLQHSFRYQPASGFIAKGTLSHIEPEGHFSETQIDVDPDATITIHRMHWHDHTLPPAKVAICEMDHLAWGNLLTEIYDADMLETLKRSS
jgi:hypothetical protein